MEKRYSDEQIIGFLREAEAGVGIQDLCQLHGFSEPSFYAWRRKFGGMLVATILSACSTTSSTLAVTPMSDNELPAESSVFA